MKGRIPPEDPAPDPRELDRYLNLLQDVPAEVFAEEESRFGRWNRLGGTAVPIAIVGAVLSLYLVKLWRAFSPRFARSTALPRVGYRAILDRLAEIGFRRRFGETWDDFAQRLIGIFPEFVELTEAHMAYAFGRGRPPDAGRWWELHTAVIRRICSAAPLGRRWLGSLNPVSWIRIR